MSISLGDAIVAFKGDMTDLNKSLGQVQRETKKAFGNILTSAKEVGIGMSAMGAGILGGLGVAIKGFADAGSEAHDMAQKTGLSSEAVSELGYALKISGSDTEALNKAMIGMAKSMDNATQITGQMADAQDTKLNAATEKSNELTKEYSAKINDQRQKLIQLQSTISQHVQQMRMQGKSQQDIAAYMLKANAQVQDQQNKIRDLGAQYSDQAGKLRKSSQELMLNQDEAKGAALAYQRLGINLDQLKAMNPEQRFMTLANAVANVKDPTERAALTMKVFGKSATELLPLLSEGSAGIAKLRQEARAMGYSFSTDEANAADTLGDAIDALKASFMGASKTIIVNLVPSITQFIGWVQETVVSVTQWVRAHPQLTESLLKVAGAVGIAMAAFGPLLVMLPGLVSAFNIAAAAIPFVGIVLTALTGPIGITIAAIGALIFAGYEIVKNWDSIGQGLADAWQWIVDMTGRALEWWGSVLHKGFSFVVKLMTDPISAIKQAWATVWDFFASLWSGIVNMFQVAWSYISPIIDKLKEGINFVADHLGFGWGSASGQRATGGPITSGGYYNVGERGPETVYLPQGAKVYSSGDSSRMAAARGGGDVVNITAPLVNVQNISASNQADVDYLLRQVESRIQSTLRRRGLALA